MKKTNNDDLHALAEKCRYEAEDECLFANGVLRDDAIKAFEEKDEVARFFHENAAYVTGLVVMRIESAREGRPTFPLRSFDAETLVSLLTAATEVEYEERNFNRDLSDEEIVKASKAKKLIKTGYFATARTPSSKQQEVLLAALREYARAAAVFAKHIGSASLLDWAGMIDILENRSEDLSEPLRRDDAERLVALEKSAADRLRLDRIVAELPSYKSTRKKAK